MALRALLLRCDRFLTLAALAAASVFLGLAVVAGFWQVATRFVLSNPASWSETLVRVSLIWMVMLGLAGTLRQGALVSIDIAERLAKGAVRAVIRVLILVSNLSLLVVLCWFGAKISILVGGQTLAGLEVSIAWAYAAIPVGCALAIVGALAHFLDRQHSELEASQ